MSREIKTNRPKKSVSKTFSKGESFENVFDFIRENVSFEDSGGPRMQDEYMATTSKYIITITKES